MRVLLFLLIVLYGLLWLGMDYFGQYINPEVEIYTAENLRSDLKACIKYSRANNAGCGADIFIVNRYNSGLVSIEFNNPNDWEGNYK